MRWHAAGRVRAVAAAQVIKANETPAGAEYSPDAASVARRAIKNKALALLCATGEPRWRADALARFRAADNMTDSTAAIAAVIDTDCGERDTMLAEFYERWKDDSLVTLKWLAMQARAARSLALAGRLRSALRLPGSRCVPPHGSGWRLTWLVRARCRCCGRRAISAHGVGEGAL